MQIEIPGAAVLGVLFGVLLRWLLSPPPPPARETPILLSATDRVLPEACPDRSAALREEIEALRVELKGLSVSARMREARRIEREGAPIPWPADAGDLAPDVFERALRAALSASGEADFVSMDCEEYPCIAVVASKTTKPDGDALLVPFPSLSAALGEHGYDSDRLVGSISGNIPRDEDGYQAYNIISFGGEEEPESTETRVQFRIEKLDAAARADLEEK